MRKKLLTTLALLLMAVSGAWADNLYLEISGTTATMKYGDKGSNPYYNNGNWETNGYGDWDNFKVNVCTAITVEASCKGFDGSSLFEMFNDFQELTTITDLGNLNTSNVNDMCGLFKNCKKLTTLDLTGWDTSNVHDMSNMFLECEKLTTLTLDPIGWNTSKVANMGLMFLGCVELTTLDLSGWNTSQVGYLAYTFGYCSSLTTLDLTGWTSSNVTYMHNMFEGNEKLETIYVGDGWSTAKVTDSEDMFKGCTSLPNFNSEKIDKDYANTGANGYLNKVKVTANSDGTNYWATYYNSAHSFKADDNTTVYQAKVNGDKDAVVLTEVTSKEIPADNGVVLKSSVSSIILSVATTTATYSANDLKGTDVDLANPGNVYCLSNETTGKVRGVGFYSYGSTDGANEDGVIPAHRAYLIVTGGPTNSRGFLGFGEDDGTTAIDNGKWKIDNSAGTIYDLSGRIVTGHPRKGIYVKNGKLVVIK